MYRIYANGILIYDSRLDDYTITKGEISKELNKSGSFTFTIYPDHFIYDQIVKYKTIIAVYKNDNPDPIFRGRAINDSIGFYNDKTFTCEGELGFLLDSIHRPYSLSGTPEEIFTEFVNGHNSQVPEEKQFAVGSVTVTGESTQFDNDDYEDTFSNISDKLLDVYGGYLYITRDGSGKAVLNWLADFPYTSNQVIEFGENLLDFTQTTDAQNVKTALIPLGGTVDDQTVTIASVNGGLDYITNEKGIERYGLIFTTNQWDDITDPSELLRVAQEYLSELVNQSLTINLTAVDLSLMDKSIDSFSLGDYVRIISDPHGIDTELLLSKETIDLLKPDNDKITFGYTYASFTDRTFSNLVKGDMTKQLSNYAKKSDVSEIENEIKVVSYSLTVAGGYTKSEGSLKKQGSTVKLSMTLNNANALTAGNSYTVATISDQTRPGDNVVSLGFTDSTALFSTTVYPSGEVAISPESNILSGSSLIIKTEWML